VFLNFVVFVVFKALLGLARQLSENKPKGMSKCDIDRLVTYQYNVDCSAKRSDAESSTSDGTSQTSCVVCMCDFVQRQRVRELPCQHIFHAKCIDKWLKVVYSKFLRSPY
jgi:E3 ubiquitin-protein ligase RNF38/44